MVSGKTHEDGIQTPGHTAVASGDSMIRVGYCKVIREPAQSTPPVRTCFLFGWENTRRVLNTALPKLSGPFVFA